MGHATIPNIAAGMRINVRGQTATVEDVSRYGDYRQFGMDEPSLKGIPSILHVRYDNGVQDTVPASIPMTVADTVKETPIMCVIPSTSDDAAYRANMAAIDALACPEQYRNVKAWGKLLGFTPETVANSIQQAITDNAPSDATQKINGKWITLADIANESTRKQVQQLASE